MMSQQLYYLVIFIKYFLFLYIHVLRLIGHMPNHCLFDYVFECFFHFIQKQKEERQIFRSFNKTLKSTIKPISNTSPTPRVILSIAGCSHYEETARVTRRLQILIPEQGQRTSHGVSLPSCFLLESELQTCNKKTWLAGVQKSYNELCVLTYRSLSVCGFMHPHQDLLCCNQTAVNQQTTASQELLICRALFYRQCWIQHPCNGFLSGHVNALMTMLIPQTDNELITPPHRILMNMSTY